MSRWHNLKRDEVLEQLSSNEEVGLSSAESEKRLAQHGPNELIERGKKSPWIILLRQFTEVMVLILVVAAIISVALDEVVDAVVIMAIVVLNAILGFTQEYRAEQAMAALKKLAVPTVRVRRDRDVVEVKSTRLVPGDIVLLEAGNIVPADCRILESASLKAMEAALTGESVPVEKSVQVLLGDDLPLGDRTNMVYMGTNITYGRGTVIVVETGMSTQLGRIADLIQEVTSEQTPLQKRLDNLGKTLAVIAIAIVGLVIVFGLIRGEELELLLLTGISMAVAVVPESLPAVVTITLALGSQRMLKRQALIRELPAVETLGSVTVICSDKTGTLTENRMTVTMLDVAGNRADMDTLRDKRGLLVESNFRDDIPEQVAALSALIRAGALCNDAILKRDDNGDLRTLGDPTEGALLLAAEHLGYNLDELRKNLKRVAEVPFTSERKRMTTVHRLSGEARKNTLPWGDQPFVVLTKGAVDSLLDVSTKVLVKNEPVELDDHWRERILEANADMASKGQRVIGVSFRPWENEDLPKEEDLLEVDEVFLGMIAMLDPPRPEVSEAVLTAKKAGIRSIMITGDHPLTALRIAQELDITKNDRYITGPELAKMSTADIEGVIDDVSVFARVAPEHKLNIVEALQNKGQVAAMTGDGVNDAPALKRADIGIAMGITGTDVSKEASDMVLLDDNFATIVAAVEEGRIIYDNIRKFIKYTLSSNTGELFVMLAGPFLGMPLPLLPLQILWVNLVTDGLPGIALAVEESELGIMDRPPFRPKEGIFSRGLGTQIIWVGALMGLVSLLVGYLFWRMGHDGSWRAEAWQTMAFTTLTLSQMGNALAIRSNTESLLTIGLLSNRTMVVAVLSTFVLQLAVIYVPFLQNIFNTNALTFWELMICLVSSTVVFGAIEIYKYAKRRNRTA